MREVQITDTLHLEPLPHSTTPHPRIAALMARIYRPVYDHLWPDESAWYLAHSYGREAVERELANPHVRYYFVRYEGRDAGILMIRLQSPPPDIQLVPPGHAIVKLQKIYLGPELHGRGLGRRLLEWMETTFGGDGPTFYWLETMDTQPQAIGFYERLGYTKLEHFRFDLPLMREEYRGGWIMGKSVAGAG